MASKITGKLKELTFGRNGEQIVTLTTSADVREMFDEYQDVELDIEFKKHRQKRSLNANSYCWLLLGKLAEYTHQPVSDVYRYFIRELGGNTEILKVPDRAVESFSRIWQDKGIGWMCEPMGKALEEGYTEIMVYYGSSTFNTEEMSRLIDSIVQECQIAHIPTMPEAELNSLIASWDGRG